VGRCSNSEVGIRKSEIKEGGILKWEVGPVVVPKERDYAAARMRKLITPMRSRRGDGLSPPDCAHCAVVGAAVYPRPIAPMRSRRGGGLSPPNCAIAQS
jgi:hypothetical protein